MQSFEVVLANVAKRCEYAYGFSGAIGYLYESVKDQLRWAKLSKKKWAYTLMRVGDFLTLSEKKWKEAHLQNDEMDSSDIAKILLSAFGGGE